MKTILRRLRDERGIALIMALATTVVLGISVTATIAYTTSNQRSSSSSKARTAAYTYAEAGVNTAMSVLRLPTNNALDKYVFCPDSKNPPPGDPATTCAHTDTYDGGRTVWTGTLNQNPAAGTAYWDLTSTGYVRNPAIGKDSSRTLRASIPVVPVLTQPLNNPSWDYIFVRAPTWSGIAYSGCDMTLQQSVDVQSPLYVLGNLCFQNKAKMSKGKLVVSGSVDLQQSANQIGSSTASITAAYVGMGCRYTANPSPNTHNPCKNGAGGSPSYNDNLWAANVSGGTIPNSVPTITPPVVYWDNWYLNASPGPYFACATPQAGDPPLPSFAFDNPVASLTDTDANKLTYKNDNQGIVNLTPGSSYKCKTTNGELSWDYTNKVLTVSGTIFIDGSAKIDIGGTILYKGAATIYLTGSLLLKNTKICAYSTTSSCTLSMWDSTKDLLGFVVNGNGSVPADNQVPVGDSIQVVSAYFQGALYATNAVDVDTTALVDGPMDGSTVKLGQSSNSTFSGFTTVPVGMPGNPTVYALALTPQFNGG